MNVIYSNIIIVNFCAIGISIFSWQNNDFNFISLNLFRSTWNLTNSCISKWKETYMWIVIEIESFLDFNTNSCWVYFILCNKMTISFTSNDLHLHLHTQFKCRISRTFLNTKRSKTTEKYVHQLIVWKRMLLKSDVVKVKLFHAY